MAQATLIARIKALGAKMAAASIRAVGVAVNSVGAAGAKAAVGIQKAGKEVDKAGEKAKESSERWKKFRNNLINAFLAGAVVSLFVGQINRAVKALAGLIAETQKVNIAFTAAEIKLKASTDGAGELVEANLRAAAAAKRFGLDILTTKEALAEFLAATKLSNLGFEERLSIFESLTQASRVFSLSQERVKLAFLAVTQIASKGALAMEEVRRQLGDQIPGIVPLLAQKLGVEVPEFFRLVEAKAIDAATGLRALRDGLNDLTDEQAVIAMQTLASEIGRLQRETSLLQLSFAEVTEDGIKRFIQESQRFLSSSDDLARALGEDLVNPLVNLTTELLTFTTNLNELGVSAPVASVGVRAVGDALLGTIPGAQGLSDGLVVLNRLLTPLAEKNRVAEINALADSFEELAKSVEAGNEDLALAFKLQEDGTKKAAESILKISKALRDDLIGRAEAQRLLTSIVIKETDREKIALEKLRREHQERRKESERLIEVQARAAAGGRSAAEAQAEAQKRIQDAIKETGDTAAFQARQREVISNDLVKKLVDFEVQLSDDLDGVLAERTSGFQVDADKREDIEEGFAEAVEKIQRDLNEKLFDIREDAAEEAKEQSKVTEEIANEQLEKEVEARRKANEKIGELLEKTTEKFETEHDKQAKIAERTAEKEIKAAEKVVKRRLKLLDDQLKATRTFSQQISDLLAGGEGGTVTLGGDSSGATAASNALKAAQEELLAIRQKLIITAAESNRQLELTSKIIPRLKTEISGIGSAVAAGGADLIGFSEKLLQLFRAQTIGSSAFREELGRLGPTAVSQFTSILEQMTQVAAAGNLNVQSMEEFRLATESVLLQAGSSFSVLDDRITQTGNALDDFNAKATAAAEGGVVSTGAAVEVLGIKSDLTTEQLRGLTEALGIGVIKSDGVAVAVDEAGGQIREMGEEAEDARIKITNIGKDAAAAGPGVQVLGADSELTTEKIRQLTEALGIGVIESDGVAVSAEEAGGQIREMGDGAKEARIKITNMGKESKAAGGGVQVLEKDAGAASKTVGELADQTERVSKSAEVPEEAIASIRSLGEAATETVPLVEPLVEPLQAIEKAAAGLAESVPKLPEPLGKVAADLKALVEDKILSKAAEGFQGLADAVEPLAERLPVIATETERFVKVAGESEEPLDKLRGGLTKVSSKDLVDQLVSMAESIQSIREELERLAKEGQGFERAGAAAEAFRDDVTKTQEKLVEFIEFLREEANKALVEHAERWDQTSDKIRAYRRNLETLARETFPEVTEAGVAMFDTLDARADATAARIKNIIADLKTAIALANSLDS